MKKIIYLGSLWNSKNSYKDIMIHDRPVWVNIAVLIPIKFPFEFNKGPPLRWEKKNLPTKKSKQCSFFFQGSLLRFCLLYLFPGLIAASVWIPPLIVTPVWLKMSLFSPLMTPTVRVWSKPNGFPIARHCCPTFRDDEFPIRIGFNNSSGASTWWIIS